MRPEPGACRARARALGRLAAVLAAAVLLGGCGGGSSAVTVVTTEPQASVLSPDELVWAQKLELFVRRLLPDLRQLQQLTGGSPQAGTVGTRLDPRVFRPGQTRRQLEAAVTALDACGTALRATVPAAPTRRLRLVRATVAHSCSQLEHVASIMREDVLPARSRAEVVPGALGQASRHAGEGVRGIVDGLATLRTLAGAAPR